MFIGSASKVVGEKKGASNIYSRYVGLPSSLHGPAGPYRIAPQRLARYTNTHICIQMFQLDFRYVSQQLASKSRLMREQEKQQWLLMTIF